jgi:hypothetical protein
MGVNFMVGYAGQLCLPACFCDHDLCCVLSQMPGKGANIQLGPGMCVSLGLPSKAFSLKELSPMQSTTL